MQDYKQRKQAKIDKFNAICGKISLRAKERGLTEEKLRELLETPIVREDNTGGVGRFKS